jgi:light-regulated signal transduction histidine kinase (bacteriophytochrome)
VVRDISERKQAEQALTERTEALERSNADLEQFAYVASHDLREPLRMVSSYMSLLERRYGDRLEKDGHEFIAFAKEGAGESGEELMRR